MHNGTLLQQRKHEGNLDMEMGHHDEDLHPLEEGPHPRGGAHQEGGTPHQDGGIPHEGGTGQNQGHLHGKLIPLDIEGDMVDLGQGLPTQGITIDDLQEEGIHQGTDHLHQVIVIIRLEDLGHHLPTGRLDWVSLDGIFLLQVLAMPPPSEIWRRNSLGLDA